MLKESQTKNLTMTSLQLVGSVIVLSSDESDRLAKFLIQARDMRHFEDCDERTGLCPVHLLLLNDALRLLRQFNDWVELQFKHRVVRSKYMQNEDIIRQRIIDTLLSFGFDLRESCRAVYSIEFPLGYSQGNFTTLAVLNLRLFAGLDLSTEQCRLLTDVIKTNCRELDPVELPKGVSSCFPAICFHLDVLSEICVKAEMTYLITPTFMSNETVMVHYNVLNPEAVF